MGQSAYLWRHQLADLSDRRRCLAFDLMAVGQIMAVTAPERVRSMVLTNCDVQAVLKDTQTFVTASEESLIHDTFGAHILTVEGAQHKAYKAILRGPFAKSVVRRTMTDAIGAHTDRLLDQVAPLGEADMRSAFASRLPILTMLFCSPV